MRKYDIKGNFIRKYIPALRNFPEEFIYEPWKANMRQQSKARCIIGVDYPSRIVTEEGIKRIFENAKYLLKKNHNIDLDLAMQKFDNDAKQKALSNNSEDKFTLKDHTPRPEKNKFRGTVKESTRIGTEGANDNSQDLVSEDRIIFRKNMENHQVDPMEKVVDPREKVIQLQSESKEKEPKNIPEHLIEKRVAGKKELQKNSQYEVVHYNANQKKPQIAWHKIDSNDGKITFIDKCTDIENKKILPAKKGALTRDRFSFKNEDSNSQIENLMKLNEKLIKMAQSHEKEAKENDQKDMIPTKKHKRSSDMLTSIKNKQESLTEYQLQNVRSTKIDSKGNTSGLVDSSKNSKSRKRLKFLSKKNSSFSTNNLLNLNPLEISTIKCTENGEKTVICHVKVKHDEMNKSVDINISNEDNNKKIMVFSRKSISKDNQKKQENSENGKVKGSQRNRKHVTNLGSLQNTYKSKMNFFMENNKLIDTDQFFQDIMERNEQIIKENTFKEDTWNQKITELRKRSDLEFNDFDA